MLHNSDIIDDGTRLGIAMYIFFGRPFREGICRHQGVQSIHHLKSLESSVYRQHEQEKRRQYEQRVEYATFTPWVELLYTRDGEKEH